MLWTNFDLPRPVAPPIATTSHRAFFRILEFRAFDIVRLSEPPSDWLERDKDKDPSILLLEGPRLVPGTGGRDSDMVELVELSDRTTLSCDGCCSGRAASIKPGPVLGPDMLFSLLSEPLELVLSEMMSSSWLISIRGSE